MTNLFAFYFRTYEGGGPVNGLHYLAEADLNTDGRINGADYTIASLLNDATVYDIESFASGADGMCREDQPVFNRLR